MLHETSLLSTPRQKQPCLFTIGLPQLRVSGRHIFVNTPLRGLFFLLWDNQLVMYAAQPWILRSQTTLPSTYSRKSLSARLNFF